MIFLFRFSFFLSEVLCLFSFFCTFDNSVIKSKQSSKQGKQALPTYLYLGIYVYTFLLSNTDFKRFEKKGPASDRIRQTVYEFSFRKGSK